MADILEFIQGCLHSFLWSQFGTTIFVVFLFGLTILTLVKLMRCV